MQCADGYGTGSATLKCIVSIPGSLDAEWVGDMPTCGMRKVLCARARNSRPLVYLFLLTFFLLLSLFSFHFASPQCGWLAVARGCLY